MPLGRPAAFAVQILALIILVASTGCARRGLILQERSDSEARAIVVGDVRAGEEGDATERRMWSVPPETFAVAIGNSAVQYDSNKQGTAISLAGTTYVHSLAAAQGSNKVEKTDGNQFTSFMVGIAPGAAPTARYKLNGGSDGIALADVYSQLARRHGDMFLVVGTGEFAFAEQLALKQPANKGEAPGDNVQQYYESNRHEFNPAGVFVGVVLADVSALRGSNMRVFSAEPGRSIPTREISRTHFAKLSSLGGVSPDDLATAKGKVQDVSRLLSISRVKEAEILVYALPDLEKR